MELNSEIPCAVIVGIALDDIKLVSLLNPPNYVFNLYFI
jgi:hypothetical protein